MPTYSPAYAEHYNAGPFPGRVDPFAEAPRYFQQVHALLIHNLIAELKTALLQRGYVLCRDLSLTIPAGNELDKTAWHHAQHAVYIQDMDGVLVTVIEVVSPSNKASAAIIEAYRERRSRTVEVRGVNVVEIDLTRSVMRLPRDPIVPSYAYHVAIHLPNQPARLIGVDYGDPLKSFALPLMQDVIAVDLQTLYNRAYVDSAVAPLIDAEGKYTADSLPFPSLLTDAQKSAALDAVAAWKERLDELRDA